MTSRPPRSDPVDVLAAADPVAAFFEAHARGGRVALCTSGTSAARRSVLRTTDSWVSSFPHITSLMSMDAASRVWVPGPVSSSMNLFASVHARSLRARLVHRPELATHAHLTPSALVRALDHGTELRGAHVVVAGDRLSRSLFERAAAGGIRVSHYYGAAELSFVAWGSHDTDLQPFPQVEVVVRDGVLWVRSPYVCEGYVGLPGALQTDRDGFATVGDRGWFTDRHLFVSGRGTAVVTTGGATVQVADVEGVLRPVVEGEVVVVGVPHQELGEVLAAVVTDALSFPRARALARDALTPAQQPRLWFEVRHLPLTTAGKVDRSALAGKLASGEGSARRLT